MSNQSILSVLRTSTMPIHKKLDQQGIGKKMRDGTFGHADYDDWLLVTFKTNHMLLTEKRRFESLTFSKFLDHDLGLGYLQHDAKEMLEIKDLNLINQDSSIGSDGVIAVVYTFLGSSLGSQFIYKYVKKNIPQASTSFLEFMTNLGSDWSSFKEQLQNHEVACDPALIGEYANNIFERIASIQQDR